MVKKVVISIALSLAAAGSCLFADTSLLARAVFGLAMFASGWRVGWLDGRTSLGPLLQRCHDRIRAYQRRSRSGDRLLWVKLKFDDTRVLRAWVPIVKHRTSGKPLVMN